MIPEAPMFKPEFPPQGFPHDPASFYSSISSMDILFNGNDIFWIVTLNLKVRGIKENYMNHLILPFRNI